MIYSLLFKSPSKLWHKLDDSIKVDNLELDTMKSNYFIILKNLPYKMNKPTYILYWNDNQEKKTQIVNKEGKAYLYLDNKDNDKIKFFITRQNKITDIFTYHLKIPIKENSKSNLLISQKNVNSKNKHLHKRLFKDKLCQDALQTDCNSGYKEDGIMFQTGLPYQSHNNGFPLPLGF